MIGKANNERGACARHRFEVDAALVFVDDDGPGNGQALPRALSDFFGGEEGVEYLFPDIEGNARPGISDADFHSRWTAHGFYRDLAFPLVPFLNTLPDRMGGVHDEVQDHLVELS